jgi:hypothetical protein
LKLILFLNWSEEKKFGPINKEFYNFLPQKLSFNTPDPRSGTRKKPISDPGVKKAPDTGSWTLTVGWTWELKNSSHETTDQDSRHENNDGKVSQKIFKKKETITISWRQERERYIQKMGNRHSEMDATKKKKNIFKRVKPGVRGTWWWKARAWWASSGWRPRWSSGSRSERVGSGRAPSCKYI